jgi:predicted nucleic acid-binding protein
MARPHESAAVRGIVFDTDILVWYLRGEDRARKFIQSVPYPERAISSLTMMELLQGCRKAAEIRAVRAFLTHNVSSLIHPDENTSQRAIGLLELHAAAHGLRVVDALIAATALESGSALATGNLRHYRAIATLHLVAFRP